MKSTLQQMLDDLAAQLRNAPIDPGPIDPGDWAGALDLITAVLDEHHGSEEIAVVGTSTSGDGNDRAGEHGDAAKDPEPVVGLATAALGVLLAEMRADGLAVRYLERARTLLPEGFGRTRVNVLQTLLAAMIRAGRVDGATGVFAELKSALPPDSGDREELLLIGRANLVLAEGAPAQALAILDRPHSGSESISVRLLRSRALNLLGRHRQVLDEMSGGTSLSGDTAEDEESLFEMAKATHALGDLAKTFELESRAFAIRSRRELGVTALLPVVDEMAVWGILDGTKQNLSDRSVDEHRINERFDQLTEHLFENLLDRVYALAGAIRQADVPLDDQARDEIRSRAENLEEVVAALDQRPHPTPPDSAIGPHQVISRICRTLEPTAAQLAIRIETDPGTDQSPRRAAPWHMYSTWRNQLLESIRRANPGSKVVVRAAGSKLHVWEEAGQEPRPS